MSVSTPVLKDGGTKDGERWWEKVVDVEEAKGQILFAMPMVLTNVTYFLMPVVSVMFVGHLGDLQLADSNLANSWANVTGYAFMTGLSLALETLCGQAFGAQRYKMLGIYLQTSCIISFMFSILISIIWWYTKPILVIVLHQNHEVSNEAAIYIRYLIPGIYAFGFIQNTLRFLQTQSVAWPLVFCSIVPLLSQIGIVHILLRYTKLGFRGAALATSIAYWVSVVMLLLYVRFARTLKQSWKGFSKESFRFIISNLKLALASSTMMCLEYWAFEVVIILAGLMPQSKESTSVVAICIYTGGIAYNFMYGLSAVASTKVSNELGATRPDRAKHAMCVAMMLSIVLTTIIVLALALGHEIWAHLFSDNINIIKSLAGMTPLLCASIALDSIRCILSGVSRGIGWQNLTMFINLIAFFGIGIPIGCLFAFTLHSHAKGLWMGLIIGIGFQTCALFLLTCLRKWKTFEQPSCGDENSGSIQLQTTNS